MKLFLCVIALFSAQLGFAETIHLTMKEKCPPLFANITFSANAISERLADVPGLRQLILRLMDDPMIPSSIKRNIKVAIEDEHTTITQLNDEILKKYFLPDYVGALKAQDDEVFG